MSKAVFLDIDGTLRDADGSVPESAIRAVRQAQKNGHMVCICSGRPYPLIEQRVLDLGFDGVVASSGAYVQHKGKVVCNACFPQQDYERLIRYLLDHHSIVEAATADASYIRKCDKEALDAIFTRSREILGAADRGGRDPLLVDSFDEVTEVTKLIVYSNDLTEEQAKRDCSYVHVVNLCRPHMEKWGGEFTPDGIDKAAGIREMLRSSGYTWEDTIAVGDNDNDLEMLRYVAVSVAMGNGTEAVRETADYVTDTLKNDGILKAFLHLGLVSPEDFEDPDGGKAVFLDIDGTIRDFDGTIADSTISAIHQARRNGHQVFISSGRPVSMIEKRITDIGFDGIIACSGGYVVYEGQCLCHLFFPRQTFLDFTRYMKEKHGITKVETDHGGYIDKADLPMHEAFNRRMEQKLGLKREHHEKTMLYESADEVENVEKMIVFSDDLSKEDLRRDWPDLQIVSLSFPSVAGCALEITDQGVNKAHGIRRIMEAGGFLQQDTIAIGDSENDLDMIRYAGTGVAMGNADDQVKQHADYVTAPIGADGIRQAFLHLGLIHE